MTISFARGVPAPECLPVDELADCAREAVRRDGRTVLSYGSTLGYEPLREWIAERHGVDAQRVVVTNGSLQAFHFVRTRVTGRGAAIVERPTYDRVLKILDGRVRAVPVDGDGLDVDALERELDAGGAASFLYTIPTFQNPAGVTLSLERRRALARAAEERSLPVLEDDPYGLVRYDGHALPSVFELEGGRNVMYTSSFSKTVAPGLRVGYLIVSAELASQLTEEIAGTYITPALLSQATVFEFVRRGLFEPNLARVCELLRARRDAMLDALDRHADGVLRWTRPDGGYFLWLELPDGVDAGDVLARGERAGVTFVKGADFGGAANTARLAFSFASPAQIEDGVERLVELAVPAARAAAV